MLPVQSSILSKRHLNGRAPMPNDPFSTTAFDAFLDGPAPTPTPPTRRRSLRTAGVGPRAEKGFVIVLAILLIVTIAAFTRGGSLHLPHGTPSACELHWQNDYVMRGELGALTHDEYLAQCNSSEATTFLPN
jgi:hypothetical protein